MKKIMMIGDVHAQISNLQQMFKLFTFIAEQARHHKVDSVLFLGDIYHTHAVLRQEVINMVQKGFMGIASHAQIDPKHVITLVGNHDGYTPTSIELNALSLTLPNHTVITHPISVGSFVLMPYYADHTKFIEEANKLGEPDKILVCHQTFNGAAYENGFYAPDGIDHKQLNYYRIISGHIHARQQFDNVIYLGTPLSANSGDYVTLSDKETYKCIWIYDLEKNVIDGIPTMNKVKNTYKVNLPQDTEMMDQLTPEFIKENEIKVFFNGSKEDYLEVQKKYGISCKYTHVTPQTKKVKKTLNSETVYSNIQSAFEMYFKEIVSGSPEEKDLLWKKVQQAQKMLGTSNIS